MNGRLRAGLVIAVIVLCSALAGAAIDRAFMARGHRGRGASRLTPEAEAKRRHEMVGHLAKDLGLNAAQKASVDSITQRTDSTMREIRRETQPRIQQTLEAWTAQVSALLDAGQRAKFDRINAERRAHSPGMQPPPDRPLQLRRP